jgi:hypothetical protein
VQVCWLQELTVIAPNLSPICNGDVPEVLMMVVWTKAPLLSIIPQATPCGRAPEGLVIVNVSPGATGDFDTVIEAPLVAEIQPIRTGVDGNGMKSTQLAGTFWLLPAALHLAGMYCTSSTLIGPPVEQLDGFPGMESHEKPLVVMHVVLARTLHFKAAELPIGGTVNERTIDG